MVDHAGVITFHGDVPRFSSEELRSKTRWIRDVLEPNVARFGPRCLTADVVLELNAFFQSLVALTQSSSHGSTSINIEALHTSRVHRALLLISGRGTRWPGKLIEICDDLIAEWTQQFGKLDMIRPRLYEQGGRLEKCKGKEDMTRHDLMIKWMGDPTKQVSPLRAQEVGHLDFKPGDWWIHPIYAFHSGIIDSPDPSGGITADGDGAYAILLTSTDEVCSDRPDEFAYRCRHKDFGLYRLLGASLPPKSSIRILRSHTLHSPWSPLAGVRYDGLYKVAKWSLRKINDQITYEIGFVRDSDQPSMREVRLRPIAEEVDDYIEYKRMREDRHARDENVRRANMSPSDCEAEDSAVEMQLMEDSTITPMARSRRYSTPPRKDSDTSSVSPGTNVPPQVKSLLEGLQSSKSPRSYFDGSHFPSDFANLNPGTDLDGTVSETERRPSIRFIPMSESPLAAELAKSRSNSASAETISLLNRVRFCEEMTSAEIREEQIAWTRKDHAHFSRLRSPSRSSSSKYESEAQTSVVNLFDGANDVSLASRSIFTHPLPHHKTLQQLAHGFEALRATTLRRNSIGSTFLEDLKRVSEVLGSWQLTSASANGYVDSCLKKLEREVHQMREHGRGNWHISFDEHDPDLSKESDAVKAYQSRYEKRISEGDGLKHMKGQADEGKDGENNSADILNSGMVKIKPSSSGLWSVGTTLRFN